MKSRSLMVFALLTAAACGGKKPAETPPPAPAPAAPIDSTAIKARMRQDSINAAEARARAAAEAAAKLQAQLLAEVTSMIHFDFDKSDIKPEDQGNLMRKAAILKANPALTIQIAGNCDEPRVGRVQPRPRQPPRGGGAALPDQPGRLGRADQHRLVR